MALIILCALPFFINWDLDLNEIWTHNKHLKWFPNASCYCYYYLDKKKKRPQTKVWFFLLWQLLVFYISSSIAIHTIQVRKECLAGGKIASD